MIFIFNKNKKKYWLLLFLSLLLQCFFLSSALAQTSAPVDTKADKDAIWYRPSVPIPGINEIFKERKQVTNKDTGEVYYVYKISSDSVGQYIKLVYKYAGVFAGALAMFMLVYAGWQWLMAAGNASKIQMAKGTISDVLVGLAFLFGGYLLLSQISGGLVNFSPLSIKTPTIKNCEVYPYELCESRGCTWTPDPNQTADTPNKGTCSTGIKCESDGLVSKFYFIGPISTTLPEIKLLPDTANALQKAVIPLANTKERIVVTSAYRSYSNQQFLYDCYMASQSGACPADCGKCNKAAPPSCTAPHVSGRAVDVCYINDATGVNTCGKMEKTFNCLDSDTGYCTPQLQAAERRLKQIMEGACFTRYNDEWWHFTYKGECGT